MRLFYVFKVQPYLAHIQGHDSRAWEEECEEEERRRKQEQEVKGDGEDRKTSSWSIRKQYGREDVYGKEG